MIIKSLSWILVGFTACMMTSCTPLEQEPSSTSNSSTVNSADYNNNSSPHAKKHRRAQRSNVHKNHSHH